MYAYIHTKSVKSVCSSRWSRASQSPNKVEKQPKSTPDMQTLPPIERARTDIYISTRTFIVAVRTLFLECCEDSDQSQTTSINVFYVIAFLRCRSQRSPILRPEEGRLALLPANGDVIRRCPNVFLEALGSKHLIRHSAIPNLSNISSVDAYSVMRPCFTSSIASLKPAVCMMSNFFACSMRGVRTVVIFHPILRD